MELEQSGTAALVHTGLFSLDTEAWPTSAATITKVRG